MSNKLTLEDIDNIEQILLHIVYDDAYTAEDTKDDQRIAFDLLEKLHE